MPTKYQWIAQVVAELTPENFPDVAETFGLPRSRYQWEHEHGGELAVLYTLDATPREAAGALLRCEGDMYLRGTQAEKATQALQDERKALSR